MTWECDSCDREFYSWSAVKQHMNALEHWQWPHECDTCERRFGSQSAVNQHMNALDHWYASSASSEDHDEFECDKCDRTFSSWDGCKQHMSALDHWFTDVCDTCERRFVNRHALEQHMDAVGHRSSHYCSSCDRHFQNPSDLFQHMNSPIHLRAKTTNAAPVPPVRTTTTRKSASTAPSTPVVPVLNIPAVVASPPSTRSQPDSRPPAPLPAATPRKSSTVESRVTPQEALISLAVDDNANFHHVYEARSRVMKLVDSNDGKLEWTSQGYRPTRILVSKDTLAPRILMYADSPSGVGLSFDVPLDSTLHVVEDRKIVRLNVPIKGEEKTESFILGFKDESKAQEFLDELHKAIAKAQASPSNSPIFSLSEVKVQETAPLERLEFSNCSICQVQSPTFVARSQVVNCPFCRLGFCTVTEVLQHLETTSCRSRPDLNRVNIYHYLRRYDTPGHITESFSNSDVSVSSNEKLLYRCPGMTGRCQGKRLPSFAALQAHLTSEDCEFDGRSDLLQHIRVIEEWVPTFGSC